MTRPNPAALPAAAALVLAALVLAALGLAAALPGAAAAQAPAASPGPSPTFGGGAWFETYRFDEPDAVGTRTLTLLTLPVAARIGLVGASSIEVSGSYARATLEREDGSEAEIQGLTDTALRLRVPVGRGLATLSAIAVLPTGHTTHTAAEAEVAGAIAADLLPFRITNWGSGGAAGVGATAARVVNGFGVGAGAMYLVTREYEPIELGRFAYRPGNMLRINLAADRTIGAAGKASLLLVFQHTAADALDGANLYSPGDRFEAMGSYAFALGAGSTGIVYLGGLRRQRGTALMDVTLDAPAQDLLVAGGGLRLVAGGATLLPSADLRLFRSDDGVGQGYVGALGLMAELPAGGVTVVPAARVRLGDVVVRQGRESAFRGGELGVALRFGGRR